MLFRDAAVLGILRLRGGDDDDDEDLFADENAQDAAAAAGILCWSESASMSLFISPPTFDCMLHVGCFA